MFDTDIVNWFRFIFNIRLYYSSFEWLLQSEVVSGRIAANGTRLAAVAVVRVPIVCLLVEDN